jgi:CheY-like chemotaxis protein/pSer/pThr/pTyr-binding forkhead associated (FHA) protein
MTQGSTNTGDWTLEISFSHMPETIRVLVKDELLVGRPESGQSVFTGLDLTTYQGADLGVSRRHALVRWQGNHLVISDLNSDNGTILNGTRLQPDIPYRLSDGDTLYLGHLKMTLRLNSNYGLSTIRARRAELDMSNVPAKAHGQRIMVVEDDVQITKLYQKLLEDYGFSVQVCRDVVSAIRVLNQQTPALIMLDIRLPGVHGLELCRYVRRDTEIPDIPIIVASALSDEDTVQQALQAGVDVYFSKPLNIRELVRVVAALVYKHEQENPAMHTKKLAGTASLDFVAAANRNDTIIIFVDGQREPLGTIIDKEIVFGRGNPGAPTRNYVDLGPYGAFDKGVSRAHAKIRRQDKAFVIEDLDSANGTFINGHSLSTGEVHTLKNGDEVRLGDLRMHIYLLAETVLAQSN